MCFPERLHGYPQVAVANTNRKDIVVAGGLHKAIATEYFRVGHMGITVTQPERGDLDKVLKGIEEVLKAARAGDKA
jgi:aspartate aminotransferase-like enzyme